MYLSALAEPGAEQRERHVKILVGGDSFMRGELLVDALRAEFEPLEIELDIRLLDSDWPETPY
jgi:hypothetical protein